MKQLWLCVLTLFPLCLTANEQAAVLLWYLEQEAGQVPDRVRYIVTDDYMRIDDGGSKNGFVLLDRKRHKVFNVVPDTRSILVIDGDGELPAVPDSLHIDERQSRDKDAPPIGGKTTLQVVVSANDDRCYTGIVAPGLLDKAAGAMAEFSRVLAVQQQRTIDNTAAEFLTPCFLAQYLYAPGRHLAHGVPVEEWNKEGRRRTLLDYDAAASVDDVLFALPADYLRYTPGTVPGSAGTE